MARLVVERHGPESLVVVTDRIRAWLDAEDYGWVAVWAQVAQDVCEMLPEVRQHRPALRTQAPLGELMDDPVMNAVVGDDHERRREVHETLRSAKRRLAR